MAGMVLVKVENGQAMLDHPKERKPMETAQAIFEKQIKCHLPLVVQPSWHVVAGAVLLDRHRAGEKTLHRTAQNP